MRIRMTACPNQDQYSAVSCTTSPVTQVADVAVGAGHGVQWWQEFFSVVRMGGYDDVVSLEMEDLTLPMLEGHLSSLRTLKEALVL